MVSGPEMDELVHVWVFGHERGQNHVELDGHKLPYVWVKDGQPVGFGQPDYSIGLLAAWIVFEAVAGINAILKNHLPRRDDGGASALTGAG